MGIFRAQVLKWQKDSWKRTTDYGLYFCLNTNRVSEVRDGGDQTCTLYYTDNPFNDRDSPAYMKLNCPVSAVKSYMDDTVDHDYVTMNVYEDNDPTKTTTEVTIHIDNFAYAVADRNSILRTWVTYTEDGWDIKTVLCNNVCSGFATTDD